MKLHRQVLTATLFLASCQTTFHHDTKTIEDQKKDYAECSIQASIAADQMGGPVAVGNPGFARQYTKQCMVKNGWVAQ